MKLKYIILFALLLAGGVLLTLFFSALHEHRDKVAKIEHIPDVTLVTIDGDTFSLQSQKPSRKTAIMFFSPDCEFCMKELEGIVNARNDFSGIDWVFVTLAQREELDSFLQYYPLETIPGARICIEDKPELLMALDISAPPALFVYNADGYLEQCQRGAVSIQTIIEWLR